MIGLLFLCLTGPVFFVLCENNVVVDTPKGPIKGRNVGTYDTFFGIPYARVEKKNPFGVSTKQPNFDKPFDAFDASVKCPQAALAAEGTLQCLRLNIYVPHHQNGTKLPVFVWFHGGGFFFGSAGDYDGQHLIKQDIIVVTANYRLGPYGFLCLNDPEVPGNQGLRDQVDALKWVKDNIDAFGGDASKVTIAGESYGGGSVELHLYSEFDKYFDKAIIQSGAARVEAMFVKPDHKAAIKLAKLFNYTATDNSQALEFLSEVDPIELMKTFTTSGIILRACKEKKFRNVQNFLTTDPFHLYKPKKIKDTPVIIGYNSKEAFVDVIRQQDADFERNQDIVFDKLKSYFNLKPKELRRLANITQKFYLGSKPVSKENQLNLVDFMSDFMLNNAAEKAVTRLVDQDAKVYKYLFSYTGNSPYKNMTGVGAYHTEELQYLFQMKAVLSEPEHFLMRDRMTTMWANFAKFGNPTPEVTKLLPVDWTMLPKGTRPYMDIDKEMTMKDDVYHQRMAFWDLIWNTYQKKSTIL